MNVTKPQVIFAAEGFSARPDLIAHAEAKAATPNASLKKLLYGGDTWKVE